MRRVSAARSTAARRIAAALALALAGALAGVHAPQPAAAGSGPGPGAPHVTPAHPAELAVETATGVHRFRIELRDDDAGRMTGLMHRRAMPDNHGMLFDFGREEPVAMWMKNTLLPLDMLFIRADGTILSIAENATPLSTRIIFSGGPVRYVLELNAGAAARIGARPGDQVVHPAIRP
ncbi:DUF192 domain-containing protein [Camelimonas abortus]|uniref:DUF192 domain-containing protein n=1 Tax=Camelimonas abortus TaxID=1017184 RepID=A0ABV7LEA6_9HYPH